MDGRWTRARWYLYGCLAQYLPESATAPVRRGIMPQYPDPDVINVICPDIENPVIFELCRLNN
jgi:hypothetical protein